MSYFGLVYSMLESLALSKMTMYPRELERSFSTWKICSCTGWINSWRFWKSSPSTPNLAFCMSVASVLLEEISSSRFRRISEVSNTRSAR